MGTCYKYPCDDDSKFSELWNYPCYAYSLRGAYLSKIKIHDDVVQTDLYKNYVCTNMV